MMRILDLPQHLKALLVPSGVSTAAHTDRDTDNPCAQPRQQGRPSLTKIESREGADASQTTTWRLASEIVPHPPPLQPRRAPWIELPGIATRRDTQSSKYTIREIVIYEDEAICLLIRLYEPVGLVHAHS